MNGDRLEGAFAKRHEFPDMERPKLEKSKGGLLGWRYVARGQNLGQDSARGKHARAAKIEGERGVEADDRG